MKKIKDKVIKLKRKHVNWRDVLFDLVDPAIDAEYYTLLQKHPCMSMNRAAYIAIRKHSTTATMIELRLKYGVL